MDETMSTVMITLAFVGLPLTVWGGMIFSMSDEGSSDRGFGVAWLMTGVPLLVVPGLLLIGSTL